jgi:protein-S-isoprenylcysteine O-methyltransferase Ste14
MAKTSAENAFLGYLATILVGAVMLAVVRHNVFYADFLQNIAFEHQDKWPVNVAFFRTFFFEYQDNQWVTNGAIVLTKIFWVYVIVGLPIALFLPRQSKTLLALAGAGKGILSGVSSILRRETAFRFHGITRDEKVAMLFLLVKIFFIPVMVQFVLGNAHDVLHAWYANEGRGGVSATQLFLMAYFPLLMALMFFIDTAYFVFGYCVELPALRNEVRSVEPTLFGWVVALLCYPPFNRVPDFYFTWTAQDNPTVANDATLNVVLCGGMLLFTAIYLFATLALGAKCSNLTNRGIVSRGPYALVRHPAYVAKNISWWIASVPWFMDLEHQPIFFFGVVSMAVWSTIYVLRALTEERHLLMDPEYQEYCERVRWRFIPFLF